MQAGHQARATDVSPVVQAATLPSLAGQQAMPGARLRAHGGKMPPSSANNLIAKLQRGLTGMIPPLAGVQGRFVVPGRSPACPHHAMRELASHRDSGAPLS